MRIRRETRDRLAQRQSDFGYASLDEALEALLFQQESAEAIARLLADPVGLAAYQQQAHLWAELDQPIGSAK